MSSEGRHHLPTHSRNSRLCLATATNHQGYKDPCDACINTRGVSSLPPWLGFIGCTQCARSAHAVQQLGPKLLKKLRAVFTIVIIVLKESISLVYEEDVHFDLFQKLVGLLKRISHLRLSLHLPHRSKPKHTKIDIPQLIPQPPTIVQHRIHWQAI